MKYSNIERAFFKERPNRFIAYVETEEGREICHVKNTGRCKELLTSDAVVYVQRNDNPARKTKLDLIGVEKGDYLINMDSQAPNAAVKEWLQAGNLFSKNAVVYSEARQYQANLEKLMEILQRNLGGDKVSLYDVYNFLKLNEQ